MHAKIMARTLICSLFFAVGCVDEWHSDGFDDDFDTDSPGRTNNGQCSCDDDPPNNTPPDNIPDGCPEAEGTIYVGTTESVCTTIGFTCPDTHTSFNQTGCGCGCEPIPEPPPCPTEDGEGITVVSRDLKVCSTITFTCPEGSDPFNGTCGCGCIAATSTTPTCPDPEAANVHYLGEDGSAVCEMVSFTCPAQCVQFNNECGCGCIEPE